MCSSSRREKHFEADKGPGCSANRFSLSPALHLRGGLMRASLLLGLAVSRLLSTRKQTCFLSLLCFCPHSAQVITEDAKPSCTLLPITCLIL